MVYSGCGCNGVVFHTGNGVSSCVGGVVGRSCVYFGHEEAVWFEWDYL
jgi:hypothetical protein